MKRRPGGIPLWGPLLMGLLSLTAVAWPVTALGQTYQESSPLVWTDPDSSRGLLPIVTPPETTFDEAIGAFDVAIGGFDAAIGGFDAAIGSGEQPRIALQRLPQVTLPESGEPDNGLPGFALPPYVLLDGQPAIMEPGASVPSTLEARPYQAAGISDYKKSFFQKLAFTGTWLPRDSEHNLGWTRWDVALTVAAPAPTIEWPLLLTPAFSVWQTEGPATPDLPASLYQASLQLMWLPKLSERWRLILSVTPGVYTDFEHSDSKALRITGLGVAAYDWIPDRLQVVFGVVYLDRDDINILPAVGLTWTPNDDVKLDLVMPRPRLAYRWNYDVDFEDWVYLAGELGGGTWQIELEGLSTDRMTVRDFRIMLGVERKRDGGAGARFEVGYVLGREIEFREDPISYSLGDTLMLRTGIAF